MPNIEKPRPAKENMAEQELANVAQQEMKNAKTKKAYATGSTARLLKKLVIIQHVLDPSLVSNKMLNQLTITEVEIAKTRNQIFADKYPINQTLDGIENRVTSLGQQKNTAPFHQTYSQQLPSFRDSVQNINNEKNKIQEAADEFRNYFNTKIKDIIQQARKAIDGGSNKANVKKTLSGEFNNLLQSIEIEKRKKSLQSGTERLDINENALYKKLSQLENETRSIAAAAGIKVEQAAPKPNR